MPKLLVDSIGIDYFASVKVVILDCEEIYDLSKLVGLTQLEDLYINQHVHDVRVFDALRELPQLKKISLSKWSGLSRAEIESIAKTLDHVEVVKEEE